MENRNFFSITIKMKKKKNNCMGNRDNLIRNKI